MAEARVTQLGALAELSATPAAWLTQFGVLAELSTGQARITLFGVLLEMEYVPPPGPQPGGPPQSAASGSPGAAAGAAPAGGAAPVSRAAAAAGGALFAALAMSMAAVAPTTRIASALSPAATGREGGGVSATRAIVPEVIVCWDGTNPVDESVYFVAAKGASSLIAPEQLLVGGRGAVDGCSITLSNHTRRFSQRNTAGALYDNIGNGAAYLRPVTVSVTVDGVKHLLFTGVLREMSESAPTAAAAASVVLDCRSRDELLLQDRRSSELGDYLAASESAHGEAQHIAWLLELAGLTDGVDFVSQAYAVAHPGAFPTIDPSIFALRYVWLDDESVLEDLWSLAAACCGWLYTDHTGKIHYHNICGVLPAQLAKQYGAVTTLELNETQAAGLRLSWPTADLYGEVTVEVAPRAPGQLEEVWAPDDVIVVQPGETKIIWARLDSALAAEPVLAWAAYTAGGLAIASGVTVTPDYYAQRVKLEIANTGAVAAHLNELTLTGQTLAGGRTVEVTESSGQAFWTGRTAVRRRSVRGNIYIQGEAQARYMLARDQLDRIRLHRNSAVHNEKRFHLADAQEVRGVLFTEGLLAQMSFLLSRAAQRQR